MLPFFVMMAVLYGALNAALDTTAGERERGSLEPLLMNPAARWALVLGKWGAVASVGMLIALLSCFSFLPAQWLLRSDTLAAMFQFGPARGGAVPGGAAAARGGAVGGADGGRDPLQDLQGGAGQQHGRRPGGVAAAAGHVFNQGGEAPWHLWVPALAQNDADDARAEGRGARADAGAVPLRCASR